MRLRSAAPALVAYTCISACWTHARSSGPSAFPFTCLQLVISSLTSNRRNEAMVVYYLASSTRQHDAPSLF